MEWVLIITLLLGGKEEVAKEMARVEGLRSSSTCMRIAPQIVDAVTPFNEEDTPSFVVRCQKETKK